jgi:HD superfamily phosphohydrolase
MSGKAFEVRDPIHTSIPFDAFERQVIDHPFVQRLRHIKQVGLVSLVYPGGHHDRFSHSLGVMHLAGRLFDGIAAPESRFVDVFSKEQCAYLRTCVRLAGLLHDVGHPPFSHSLEELLPDLSLLDLPKTWFESALPKRQSRHEDFTLWLINALSERYHVFDAHMAQDVASLVHHKVRPSESGAKFKGKGGWNAHGLLRSLISGECDADRMDYLLRDSYHCGVAYGSYDLSRIIFSMQPYFDTASHNVHLCMDANGIYSFEDFLLARYHMFLQVYLHKTVICFDHFLQQAFLEREIQFPHLKSPEEYMRLTDHDVHVWRFLLSLLWTCTG